MEMWQISWAMLKVLVVINLKPAELCACFFLSCDQLLGNSNREWEKLDLIRVRVVNVNTMEREEKKGFDGDGRGQL